MRRVRVALEGPSCACKTTLCLHLAYAWCGSVVIVPDHSAEVGRWGAFRSDMPAAPSQSAQEEDIALRRLVEFERERFAACPETFDDASLTIIDRSVLSLIAHCAGLDRVYGVDVYERRAIDVVRASDAAVWPTHVIYVDVATEVQRRRYGSRTPPLFADPAFNEGIKDYFRRLDADESMPILWLDAASGSQLLVDRAVAFLSEYADRDG
ncbi:MAG: hypothetical protein LC808_00380 [Actinobacteria bacterium]|nr:hypothetical protein [Actinomycetota bacterium]